jgi:hypothetical protein
MISNKNKMKLKKRRPTTKTPEKEEKGDQQ